MARWSKSTVKLILSRETRISSISCAILAQLLTTEALADTEALAAAALPGGENVEEFRKALVMKLGENISIRRFARYADAGPSCFISAWRKNRRNG